MGDVELPAFVGGVRAEPLILLFGRLWGCGVTNPRADRIRQIVDTAGTLEAVAVLEVGGDGVGAGFVPAAVEFLAEHDDLLLDPAGSGRGWSAGGGTAAPRPGSPSVRNRATRVITQRRETP